MIRKLCLGLVLVFAVGAASAQSIDFQSQIPADPQVRIGQLENGLTYYIRHNAKPEGMADFYIYHDVGAIQEEDSQIGLAHFLEHMAFNGTDNLPGKTMSNYLESIGVKYGANLNAMTGQEMTIYMMADVPLSREGIIDTALLVLHDWSHFITLDPQEVDNERGVIIEELRTGNDGNYRIMMETAETTFNGSKYARRNIIGEEDHLRTFPHQEIVDFYHRWYRPDLQTLIIVGDVDVDQIENKIKTVMADIPARENPEPKVPYLIPDNHEPLIAIATDPEVNVSRVIMTLRSEAFPPEANDYAIIWKLNQMVDMIKRITAYRFDEISNSPNSPFVAAGVYYRPMTAQTEMFGIQAISRDGETNVAFRAVYEELEKIRRFGFTQSEFERAQTEMMREAERRYDGRHDRRNSDFIWQYVNNFSKNKPIPTEEYRWELDSTFLATANIMELNMLAQEFISTENQSVVISGPRKAGVSYPSEADVRTIMAEVREADLQPYEDNDVKEPLIDGELTPGTVVSESTDRYGATVWTLSNGATVVILPTDFKKDEIKMRVVSEGGLSVLSDRDYITGEFMEDLVPMSGVGKFSAVELGKQLVGKSADVKLSVSNYHNGFEGTASPKDFETQLQLLHLYFTQPRFTEQDSELFIDRVSTLLSNISNNPDFIFPDSLESTRYGHNLRRRFISMDRLNGVNTERAEVVYRQLYNNADDFTYIFVGNLDPQTVRPLIEKYIGSLKGADDRKQAVDDGVRISKGQVANIFTVPMQAPKTVVAYTFSGDIDYTSENIVYGDVLRQILSMRYNESVREEMGGTYGVQVDFRLYKRPVESYELGVMFETDPNLVEELVPLVTKEIATIAQEGPRSDDLQKVREYLMKKRSDDLRNNNQWVVYLLNWYLNGIDRNENYDAMIEALSPDKVQQFARRVIEDGNVIRVQMNPEI